MLLSNIKYWYKFYLNHENEIFPDSSNTEQANLPIDSENSGASNIAPNTDIQQFVLLLKSKLQKIHLRQLIGEIKVYKENGMITPLLDLLKELLLKESISKEDINRFRPFVRKNDEEAFDNVLWRAKIHMQIQILYFAFLRFGINNKKYITSSARLMLLCALYNFYLKCSCA